MDKVKQLELENQMAAILARLTAQGIGDIVAAVNEVSNLLINEKDAAGREYLQTHHSKLMEVYKARREEQDALERMREQVLAALKKAKKERKREQS